MKIRLVSVGSDLKAIEISLLLPAVVGRGRGTNLTLPHPLISRQHCELYEAGGTLMVRDLGSLNGTYVGNQRVTNAAVPPGELLTVATVNFRVVYDDASPKDDSESPLLVGDDDSTRGPRGLPQDPPPSPAAGMSNAAEPADGGGQERHTQRQAGNTQIDNPRGRGS
jgi:hypothetical protein